MMRFAIVGLVACGSAPPPPPAAPPKAPPPPPVVKPFGRYTAVQPDGYKLDVRTESIAFERDGIMIALIDGADQEPALPAKCLGQLTAFATGVVSGMARAMTNVDVVSGVPLPNGCKMTGAVAGAGLVEAAVLDLGGGGVAFAILLHEQATDGASAAFERVVASIRRGP